MWLRHSSDQTNGGHGKMAARKKIKIMENKLEGTIFT
jgi:hypothetical protein